MRKAFKNPKGGLSEAGRKHFNRTTGSNLKRPQKTGTDGRRISFAARFSGMKGPMKDSKGRPTRKALALKAWGFGSVEAARNFANRHKKTQRRFIMPGHYGKSKTKGKTLTKKQKTLPASLQKKIMASKKRKK